MDQFAVFHFNINHNERNYQLMLQPGCSFEDIFTVLEKFKNDFTEMEKIAKEREEKSKQKTDQGEANG